MVEKTFDCLIKNHFLSQRGSAFTVLTCSTVITSGGATGDKMPGFSGKNL